MEHELFGLTDADAAVWASNAQPNVDGSKLRYSKELGSGDQRIFMNDDESKMIVEVSFALTGENRQRSSGGVEIFLFINKIFSLDIFKNIFFN